MTLSVSVTIYFPAHYGHTGSPDWGDVPQGRLWVESRPRRLRPCGPVRSCGPVPFAVTAQRRLTYASHMDFVSFTFFICLFQS